MKAPEEIENIKEIKMRILEEGRTRERRWAISPEAEEEAKVV